MHSHDNDAPIRSTPRPHLGWHKPKRVVVGSLIYNDERPQPGDPIIPLHQTARHVDVRGRHRAWNPFDGGDV